MTSLQAARLRLLRAGRQAASRPLRQPSYTYKRIELTRVLAAMREQGVRDPSFEVNDKDDAYRWARGLGIRVPEQLGVFTDVEDVPWAALPRRFVLKPCKGSTSAGVYLLERRGTSWLELRDHRPLTSEEITAEYSTLCRAGQLSADLMLEELVDDPRYPNLPPVDYKFYMFYGNVGIVKAKSHGVTSRGGTDSWRDFDANWRDMGNAFHHYNANRSIPPPIHRDESLAMARLISTAVPRPFLRVDLYDDVNGPVFGEITPMPGGDNIVSPRVDRLLGELWEDAEARLRSELVQAGALNVRRSVSTLSQAMPPAAAIE